MKKKILIIISIIVFVLLVCGLWGIFQNLLTESGRKEFGNMITNMGASGYLVIIGLTISQIFLFILPGEPIELLAGMCYGTFGGLIVIYIGVFISNCIIFWLVRKVGKESVYDFIGKEKIKKIESSKFFNSNNIENLLLLMFVIPGTPKDLLTYIGALLPINAVKFIVLSTLLRFPSIITSTIVGSSIAIWETEFGITVYIVTFVLSLIILHFSTKKNSVKEIMEINK